MAIQVSGTEVISNSRALNNIASVDATTAAAIGAAGVGGKVLQVVSRQDTTMYTKTTSYSTTTLPNYYVTITPSSTSSKILVFITGGAVQENNVSEHGLDIQRTGPSTSYLFGSGTNFFGQKSMPGRANGISLINLDSPSTTSATTYTLVTRHWAGGSVTFNNSNQACMTMTAMEIAG